MPAHGIARIGGLNGRSKDGERIAVEFTFGSGHAGQKIGSPRILRTISAGSPPPASIE